MSIEHTSPSHEQSNFNQYVFGFISSLVLTSVAFLAVEHHTFNRAVTIGAIVALALIQLFIQFVFFLHLNRESKPRWNLFVFGFMALVVLILVVGSLWIMNHLQYNGMSPAQIDKSVSQDEEVSL